MTPAEKSFLIDSLRSSCKPTKIYKTLDIKKSTYYYKKISSEFSVHKKQDSLILPLIRKIHSEARKTYGVKRITLSLKDYSLPFTVGEKRIRRIIRCIRFFSARCDFLYSRYTSSLTSTFSPLIARKYFLPSLLLFI